MSDVLSVLGPYLGDPAGTPSDNNFKFRCPFHKGGEERKPSFYINADSGLAFCHTCKSGWNLVTLLKELQAPRRIIDAACKLIKLDKGKERFSDGYRPPVIPEELLAVFEHCPVDLLDVGFEMPLLQKYEIGYHLALDRVTYPLRDEVGRLIGVSGREDWGYKFYEGDEYLELLGYYPGAALKASRHLWNLHRIYPKYFHGVCDDPIIVTEGYKAALWCIQHGYENTVCLMGSFLSETQTRLLERLGSRIILLLDFDRAGIRGTYYAVQKLRKTQDLFIGEYPLWADWRDKVQPDDLDKVDLDNTIINAVPYYKSPYNKALTRKEIKNEFIERRISTARAESRSRAKAQETEVPELWGRMEANDR